MNKKIIRLTESDLINVVNKVLKEQSENLQSENINPKNLKLGDRGEDVKILQQKLIDKGFLKTKNMKPTGYFGELTNAALSKALGKPTPKPTPKPKSKTTSSGSGFIMIFAFPDYRPSAGNDWVNKNILAPVTNALFEDLNTADSKTTVKMGKLGHGGCVIIQPDGNTGLFEFGRYESDDYGVVRKKNLGKISKIKNGKLLNAKQVAMIAKSKTQGDGPKLRMDVAVISLPKPKNALQYADVKGPQDYTITDIAQGGAKNCGTYALEAAIAGGVKTSFLCFASPKGVVNHVRPLALQTFII